MRFRLGLLTVLLVVIAGGVAACGGSSGSSANSEGASITGPSPTCSRQSGGTLNLGMAEDLITWDLDQQPIGTPTLLNAVNLVFDRLVRPTPDLQSFENRLATSIKHNPDFTQWTIDVRPGVKFQDGSSLDAKDVVFSLDYYLKGSGAFAFGPVKKITATGPLTVQVDYKQPYADLVSEGLSSFSGAILPNNFAGESPAEFWKKPIGTGPYEIVSSRPSSEIVFQRNPNYWDGNKPYIDRVDMKIVPDSNDRVLGLEGGTFDVIARVPPDNVDTLGSGLQARVLKPSTNADLLVLSSKTPLLRDRSVRQAMSYAIDRAAVAKGAYNNFAQPTVQLIPDAQPNTVPPDNPPTYDVSKARQLMASSNFPHGGQAVMEYIKGDASIALEAQIIQQELAAIGIHLSLQPLGAGEYFDRATSGQQEVALSHSESVVADPYDLLSFDVATKGFYGNWPVGVVAGLEGRFAATEDAQQRTQIVHDYENFVTDQARQIPIVNPDWLDAQSVKVANLRMSLINEWYIEDAWLCS